jgi:hypothetical protein
MKHLADRNPITGAALITPPSNQNYRDNYDRIFRRTYQQGNETFEDVVTRITNTIEAQPGSREDDVQESDSKGAS